MLKEKEHQYELLLKAKAESEESITNNYLEIVKEKDNINDEVVKQNHIFYRKVKSLKYFQLKEKILKQVKEHELIKQQIEDDCDREIYELKASHEKDMKEEQDLNVRLRGEAGVVKKKLLGQFYD